MYFPDYYPQILSSERRAIKTQYIYIYILPLKVIKLIEI